MTTNKKYLEKLQSEATNSINGLSSEEEIESWRIDYLGRKGKISNFFQTFNKLSAEEKNELGSLANKLKNTLEQLFEEKSKKSNSNNYMADMNLPSFSDDEEINNTTIQYDEFGNEI